jgi:hypothetical protein
MAEEPEGPYVLYEDAAAHGAVVCARLSAQEKDADELLDPLVTMPASKLAETLEASRAQGREEVMAKANEIAGLTEDGMWIIYLPNLQYEVSLLSSAPPEPDKLAGLREAALFALPKMHAGFQRLRNIDTDPNSGDYWWGPLQEAWEGLRAALGASQ